MIWLYDNAIVDDLRTSFNSDLTGSPVVSVVPPEDIVGIAAQVQEDRLKFPLVAVTREDSVPIDQELANYTRRHKGVATVFDSKTNQLYFEKAVPIKLDYTLICMSTNTADVDELIRELIFKYTSQYFLTISVPYESKRTLRFGIRLDDNEITRYSATSNYLQEGKLHSAGLKLHVDGAVLLSYTPVKLRRLVTEVDSSSLPARTLYTSREEASDDDLQE